MMQAGRRGSEAAVRALAVGGGCAAVLAIAWFALGGRTLPSGSAAVGVLAGVGIGALAGFVNGGLITSLGLPPFIVTLATLVIYRGLALLSTGGVPVNPDYTWTASAKGAMDSLRMLHFGSFLGLPPNVWIAFGVVLIGVPLLHLTVLGRYAYAIGSNERTARLCGVNVDRYKTLCYVISGAAAGLAGVTMAAKFKAGQPAEFAGAELTVIAAVVIGGTSLFGGEGTIVGTLLGVLMLGLLYSGCVIADMSTFKQLIFIGGTILLAAALDRFRHLRG
jgi:ribose transport system permease protein